MRARFPSIAWLLLPLATVTGAAAEAPRIHVAGEEHPPVLERIDLAESGLRAVVFSADGRRAAVVVETTDRAGRSTLRLHDTAGDEPREIVVSGEIRALLFDRDGERLLALRHRSARKGEGDTQLLTLDWADGRMHQAMRVPASARALDHWIEGAALLIAARNELRTVLLPELRSGPLYRVLGENLSVAALGGNVVLVGQERTLALVDLSDPSGRAAMPLRAEVATPAPIVSLAAAAGGEVLAGLADGRLFAVRLEPLGLEPRPESAGIVAARAAAAGRAAPRIAPRPLTAPPRSEPPAKPIPAPAPVREAPPRSEPPAKPIPARPPAPAPEPAREPVREPVPAPAAEPAPAAAPQLRGRILGEVALVDSVLLLGPDNILREARRVRPVDGRWAADGLPSGRYRVQLDGGGKRVLVTDPVFLQLDVVEGQRLDAPDIRVLRAF